MDFISEKLMVLCIVNIKMEFVSFGDLSLSTEELRDITEFIA